MPRFGLIKYVAAAALTFAAPAMAAEDLVYVGYSHTEQASASFMEAQFKKFRAEHPDIKFEVIGYPWRNTFQQLVLQQQSGNPPDIGQGSPAWVNVFAELDAVVDLNTVFGKDWLEQRIPVAVLETGRINGKQFSISDSFSSIGMVVNKKVLEEAGVTALPKTIDEFTAALRKVKAAKPTAVPFAISTKNIGVMHTDFNTIVWSFGGRIISPDGKVVVDNPQALAALEWLTALKKEGLIAPDIQRSDARQLHSKFLAAFSFDAPQVRGFVREMSGRGKEIDPFISSMPTPVLNASITPRAAIYSRIYMLFKKKGKTVTKNSPAARMLEDLVMNADYQVGNYEFSGNFPTTSEAIKKVNDPYVSNWLEHAATAIEVDTAPYANSGDLQKIVAEEYQAAILGAKSPSDAIKTMSSRLKAAMQQ